MYEQGERVVSCNSEMPEKKLQKHPSPKNKFKRKYLRVSAQANFHL